MKNEKSSMPHDSLFFMGKSSWGNQRCICFRLDQRRPILVGCHRDPPTPEDSSDQWPEVFSTWRDSRSEISYLIRKIDTVSKEKTSAHQGKIDLVHFSECQTNSNEDCSADTLDTTAYFRTGGARTLR